MPLIYILVRKNTKNLKSSGCQETRLSFIRDMISLSGFLPLTISWIRKDIFDESAKAGKISITPLDKRNNFVHFMAFGACISVADKFIARNFPQEMISIVAENCDHMRRNLENILEELRAPPTEGPSFLYQRQVTNIMNDIHFAGKNGSPILQLADACAWGMRAYLAGRSYGQEIITAIFGDVSPEYLAKFNEKMGATVANPKKFAPI